MVGRVGFRGYYKRSRAGMVLGCQVNARVVRVLGKKAPTEAQKGAWVGLPLGVKQKLSNEHKFIYHPT